MDLNIRRASLDDVARLSSLLHALGLFPATLENQIKETIRQIGGRVEQERLE